MAAPPPTARTDPSAAVTRIALQLGATPVAHVDIGTMLSGVCSALPPAVRVAAAVLVLTEPADPRDPESRQVFGSDDAAHRIGLIQHRAGRGPVPAAVRGDRPLVVPDLTAGGPPELAAAAADSGLVRSLVVPLSASGRPVGGLQMLAGADATLDERTASVLWPVVAAVAARLADARELARVSALVVDDVDHPAGPDDAEPAGGEDPETPPATTLVPVLAGTGTPASAASAGPGDALPQATTRLPSVTPAAGTAGITGSDPRPDLFATGETPDGTPPAGQARLGWEGPEHTPRPTALPTRALPARVPVLGRSPRRAPRPGPAAVPAQRSGPIPVAVRPVDDPTGRVPRHRLRDDA